MKSRFSWEIVAAGALILAVGIFLYRSDDAADAVPPQSAATGDTLMHEMPHLSDAPSEGVPGDRIPSEELPSAQATDPIDGTQKQPSGMAMSRTETGGTSIETGDRSTETGDTSIDSADLAPSGRINEALSAVSKMTDELSRTFHGEARFDARYPYDRAVMVSERSFPAFALAEVKVNSDIGNILLIPHELDQVVVQVWVQPGRTIEDFNKQFKLTHNRNPERIEVRLVRTSGESGIRSWWRRLWSSGGREIQPGIRVLVPEGALTYNLETRLGNTEAHNVGGDIRLETRAGNIEMSGLYGLIYAETRAGNVKADGLNGTVSLRSRAGNIIAENMDANSEIRTSAGNITFHTLTVDRELDLESRVGNVTARLPSVTRGRLNLDGTNVRLHEAFIVDGNKTGSYVRGTVLGGGPEIRMHTRVGNVDLTPSVN